MAWTYSTTLATARDRVRLLIGDTESTDPLLTDEELDFLLIGEGSETNAAAAACERLAARFARYAATAVGTLQVRPQERYERFRDLAVQLRREALAVVVPYAGGVSAADKGSQAADADRPQPAFTLDLHEVHRVADRPV